VRAAELVEPYELPAATVDGADVGEVHAAFGVALRAARDGKGPLLLECLTRRFDPGPSELRSGGGAPVGRAAGGDRSAGDPLARLLRRATSAGWFEASDAEDARAEAEAEVAAALAFAEASPHATAARIPRRLGRAGPS
jgi:pyruvate dehydrogenase E1 component alpha subunit